MEQIILQIAKKTAQILSSKQNELKQIQWADGEANLDSQFSKLACLCTNHAFLILKKSYNQLAKFSLNCSPPDISMILMGEEGERLEYKIELKSSKSRVILGSTIRNLDINQSLIFCLRPTEEDGEYMVKCDQYFNAIRISEVDTFQDRTPRPRISWDMMDEGREYERRDKGDYIEQYSCAALRRLENGINSSWQDLLVASIKDKVVREFIEKTDVREFRRLRKEIAPMEKRHRKKNAEEEVDVFMEGLALSLERKCNISGIYEKK